MNKTTKRVLAGLASVIIIIVISYAAAYTYLYVYAAYTWQCKIYVGEMSNEGRRVCKHFNEGGFVRVLTN